MNRSDDYIMGGASGSPNDQWKRIFDDASEAPPPRVWDAVERQLDLDDEDGIIPLWQHRQGQQSMLFGRWAAGIAASLLLTLFGWWAWHRQEGLMPTSTSIPQVAVTPKTTVPDQQPASPATPMAAQSHSTQPTASANVPVEALASRVPVRANRLVQHHVGPESAQEPVVAAEPLAAVEAAPTLTHAVPNEVLRTHTDAAITHHQVTNRMAYGQLTMSLTTSQAVPTSHFKQSQPMLQSMQMAKQMQPFSNSFATLHPDVPGSVPPATTSATLNEATSDRLAGNLAPLTIQPLSVRAVGNDRIVWYPAEQTDAAPVEVATPQARTERRKAWVSAGIAAAAFNPALALRSTMVAALAANPYNNSLIASPAPSINSQTGSAMTVQVNAGLPLGEHWAIETGVGYLSSQAGVQSPGHAAYTSLNNSAFDASISPTLYTDLISNRLSSNSVAYSPSANAINDYVNSAKSTRYYAADQTVSNAYQFVQVPAQVSYEFRPRRKFGLALLTGLVSNWFVRNTVNQDITVKANDGVYRPVTMAGTAGVRLRYRPDGHWSASMAGMFQQHLQSLTLNDVNLQALPQQVGLSFSVDRHF